MLVMDDEAMLTHLDGIANKILDLFESQEDGVDMSVCIDAFVSIANILGPAKNTWWQRLDPSSSPIVVPRCGHGSVRGEVLE